MIQMTWTTACFFTQLFQMKIKSTTWCTAASLASMHKLLEQYPNTKFIIIYNVRRKYYNIAMCLTAIGLWVMNIETEYPRKGLSDIIKSLKTHTNSQVSYNKGVIEWISNFIVVFTFCGELSLFLVTVSSRTILIICHSSHRFLVPVARLFLLLLLSPFLCIRRHFGYLINAIFLLTRTQKIPLIIRALNFINVI